MSKNNVSRVPNYVTLIEATYQALKELGGSGRNDEINKKVYQILGLSNKILEILHTGRTSFSEVDYRLAWARTLLKNYGAIINSARSVWVISPEFSNIDYVSGEEVDKCRNRLKQTRENNSGNVFKEEITDFPDEVKTWRQKVFDLLMRMDPFAFERLTQRVARKRVC